MDKCPRCGGTDGHYLGCIGMSKSQQKRIDAIEEMLAAPAPNVLHEALSQLRALEAAGEDPRNANQRWDVTPEQAGALLAHLDDVEEQIAQANAAATEQRLRADEGWRWRELLTVERDSAQQRHAAAVQALEQIIQIALSSSNRDNSPNYVANRMYHIADKAIAQEASDGK